MTALRPIRMADAKAIQTYCADRDLAWMAARIPHPYPPGAGDEYCRLSQSPDARNWAIVDGDTLIGVAMAKLDGDAADIGYWVGKPFAGRGHATRALIQLIGRLFADPQIERLTACVFQDNPASARVMVKAGLIQGDDCRGESVARGAGTYATWTFALSREAWEDAQ